MEEIKLWTVQQVDDIQPVATTLQPLSQLEAESQLEELIITSPEILMPGLILIGRQNPTESGFLDLLGIDQDGRLVVFELKRGTLTREAVSQLIDYASFLDEMTSESLAHYISERSGVGGIEKIVDFNSWYEQIFPNSPDGYSEPPYMVLVGLGADERTQRMTRYLAQSGVNISLLTFYAFQQEGKVILARQVNVKAPESETRIPRRYTKTSNLEALRQLADKTGARALLDSISSFFRDELPAYEWPSKSGFSYSLMERTEQGTPSYRSYISIYVNERKQKQVQLVFWDRALAIANTAINDMESKSPVKFISKTSCLETWVKSITEWETIKQLLKPVLDSIIEGWKTKNQEQQT